MDLERFKQQVAKVYGVETAKAWAEYMEANPGTSPFLAVREAREKVTPFLASIARLERVRFNSYSTFNPIDDKDLIDEPRLR